LDNFADACSIATVGLCLYGASLMQFNLRVLHSRGKLIAEFKDSAQITSVSFHPRSSHASAGRGLSANILFGFMIRVLACSSAAVVVIASFAYYFGSGRNFREYVQRYTDEVSVRMTPRHRARHARSLTVVVTLLQVADVCSICCFADWCAFSLAFAAANHKFADAATAEEAAIIEKNRKRTFNRIYRKRICQIALAWIAAIVVASHYIAPPNVKQQLGFFGVAKARQRAALHETSLLLSRSCRSISMKLQTSQAFACLLCFSPAYSLQKLSFRVSSKDCATTVSTQTALRPALTPQQSLLLLPSSPSPLASLKQQRPPSRPHSPICSSM
jgi:hypothetical protein